MKRIAAAMLIGGLATALFCGCETMLAPPKPPPYMTEAVMRSLADIFDGNWGGVKVYVQKSAWIPDDLKAAGKTPVTVTTVNDLIKTHEDQESAPAIAIVDASQDKGGEIRVTVKYTPVLIKGLGPSPIKGGSFEYVYKLIDGKLIIVSRLKPIM